MNNDVLVTRDCVTRENHWRITPLGTKKSLFTAPHMLFYIGSDNGLLPGRCQAII